MTKVRNDQILKAFGNHLRGLRKAKNISQEELANGADIPISQVGRIERGEINATLSSLHAIANALEISLSQLLAFHY